MQVICCVFGCGAVIHVPSHLRKKRLVDILPYFLKKLAPFIFGTPSLNYIGIFTCMSNLGMGIPKVIVCSVYAPSSWVNLACSSSSNTERECWVAAG